MYVVASVYSLHLDEPNVFCIESYFEHDFLRKQLNAAQNSTDIQLILPTSQINQVCLGHVLLFKERDREDGQGSGLREREYLVANNHRPESNQVHYEMYLPTWGEDLRG